MSSIRARSTKNGEKEKKDRSKDVLEGRKKKKGQKPFQGPGEENTLLLTKGKRYLSRGGGGRGEVKEASKGAVGRV